MSMNDVETKSAFGILKHVFEESTSGLLIIDSNTRMVIDANVNALNALGYAKAELLELSYTDIDLTFSISDDVKSNSYNQTFSTTYKRKDNSCFAVDAEMCSFYSDNSCYLLLSVKKKDAPSHTFSNELSSLEVGERGLRYEASGETVQEGIWQLDAENKTVFVNDFLATLLGYAKSEMIGKPLFYFMSEEEKAIAFAIINKRSQGIAEQHEFTFRSKVGSPVNTLLQNTPLIREGQYVGALVTVAEMRQRKQAERKIIAKERYFRALFQNSFDGIALLSHSGIFIDISPSIEKILGLKGEELLGTSRLDFIVPGYEHIVINAVHDVINDPLNSRTVEYEAKKGNGERIWLECTFTNLIYQPDVGAIVVNFRDITERKIAEQSLRESEGRYRTAQLQGMLGHWEWDLSNDKLLWSDEIYSIFGIDRKIGPDYSIFLNCVHPDDRELLENVIKQALSESRNYELHHRIVLADGSIKHVHEVADLVKDENGTPVKYVGMVQDVTRQKLIEEELSLSEKNYRVLFEQSPVPFWMVAPPSFKFLEVNNAAVQLYGYTREEFLNMTVRDIRLDGGESHYDSLNNLPPGEHLKLERVRHKMKNGDTLIVQLNINRMISDGRPVWLASARDITQEVEYEKQLVTQQQQLSIITNNTEDALSLLKVEGENRYRYEAVNETYSKINGKEKEEVIGRLFGEIMPSISFEQFFALFNDAVITGETRRFISIIQWHDGVRSFEVTVVPIKSDGPTVDKILVIGKDISDRKRVEDALLKSNNELRRLSSYLENVREEERANVAREIHDELGQQLTGLKMDLAWINRKLPAGEKGIAERIQSSLELVDETISSVRRIATELRPSILDDLGLAEALDWQSRDFGKRTGISMDFSSNAHQKRYPPTVAIALFRVCQEALTNVARHAHAAEVKVSLSEREGSLRLTVADNGVGFNVHKISDKKTLGLLGMKERVTMLNGTYDINSKEGEGTVLTIDISLALENGA